ncbi:hypothetical protein GIX45_06590 [Erwinia sp. CPCC 100877]|nr:hypothetical protein [Erwinia sp. CPCC 100877]
MIDRFVGRTKEISYDEEYERIVQGGGISAICITVPLNQVPAFPKSKALLCRNPPSTQLLV